MANVVSIIHFKNRSKLTGRNPRERHETRYHAFMRVVVTKKNGEKFAFRVEGLDSQSVLHKKQITVVYVKAHMKKLLPGQVIAFTDVKAWWKIAQKVRAPTQV